MSGFRGTRARSSQCEYCQKVAPRDSMTIVPKNPELRERWIRILGGEFGENLSKHTNSFICKSHFRLSLDNRRRPHDLPMANNRNSADCARKLMNPVRPIRNADESAQLRSETDFWMDVDEMDVENRVDTDNSHSRRESDVSFGKLERIIVEIPAICEILRFCRTCKSVDSVHVDFEQSGAAITFKINCQQCESNWKWESSGSVSSGSNKMKNVNIDIYSSVFSTGNDFSRLTHFASNFRLAFPSKKSYQKSLLNFIYPAVENVFKECNKRVESALEKLAKENGALDLCGDGQFDSRGYSAFYCKYSLVEARSQLVAAHSVVRKNRNEGSKSLETLGLQQCLTDFQHQFSPRKVSIRSVTTDRAKDVSNILSRTFHLPHKFDMWHFLRNIQKDLWKRRGQLQMKPVRYWMDRLVGHLYNCVKQCPDDSVRCEEMAVSFFQHMRNIHAHFETCEYYTFEVVLSCSHGPISDDLPWIDVYDVSHQKAFWLLFDIITTGNRLSELGTVSDRCTTSAVESFNARSTYYTPKEKYLYLGCGLASAIHGANREKKEVEKWTKTPTDYGWRRNITMHARSICDRSTNDDSEECAAHGDTSSGATGGAPGAADTPADSTESEGSIPARDPGPNGLEFSSSPSQRITVTPKAFKISEYEDAEKQRATRLPLEPRGDSRHFDTEVLRTRVDRRPSFGFRETAETGLLDVKTGKIVHPERSRRYSIPRAVHTTLVAGDAAKLLIEQLNVPVEEVAFTTQTIITSKHSASSPVFEPLRLASSQQPAYTPTDLNWHGSPSELRNSSTDPLASYTTVTSSELTEEWPKRLINLDEVEFLQNRGYSSQEFVSKSPVLKQTVEQIEWRDVHNVTSRRNKTKESAGSSKAPAPFPAAPWATSYAGPVGIVAPNRDDIEIMLNSEIAGALGSDVIAESFPDGTADMEPANVINESIDRVRNPRGPSG
ncbi:unnamed protein product [Caenorhabditis sp. 36 PRJEB53466]|nr:unnamed protein product [Caenorhabditis sp. 36 PRJEB53466]